MNSNLPSFNAHYAICYLFGQARKCLVHTKFVNDVREDYGDGVIYWVERPEDEYGIARAIDSRQYACVLYREDWLRGEHMRDPRHSVKQFGKGDRVKVLRQIYDVVPVGAIVTIKEVRDENPGNCDPKTPGMFPPRYVYLFDYNGRECGASYDRLELVEKANDNLIHKYRLDEDSEPIECDSCGFPGKVALYHCHVSASHHQTPYKDCFFCEVCANTFIANQFKYPEQCSNHELQKSIAILGNMILEEIRKESKQ